MNSNSQYFKIFATSFLQIGLVAINTVMITRGLVIGIFIVSVSISLLWCFNVSKLSVSKLEQKLIYSLGAGTGAVVGYFLITRILC
jgi:uncharacterized phage infection (PIP) family protein YhgE